MTTSRRAPIYRCRTFRSASPHQPFTRTAPAIWSTSSPGSGPNAAPLTVNFNVSGTGTLPGSDFTVTGANSFSTAGAADPNLTSFNTYAVKFAQYATTGAADGAVPANPHANAATDVYLYETWARPNMVAGARVATTDDTTGVVTTTTTTAPEYYLSLEAMTADLRAAYEGLAAANPIFAGVAPVGAAFLAAVQNGTAIRDPYAPDAGTDGKVDLWWDDNLHASKYGSYLSGLTLFGTLTGLDPALARRRRARRGRSRHHTGRGRGAAERRGGDARLHARCTLDGPRTGDRAAGRRHGVARDRGIVRLLGFRCRRHAHHHSHGTNAGLGRHIHRRIAHRYHRRRDGRLRSTGFSRWTMLTLRSSPPAPHASSTFSSRFPTPTVARPQRDIAVTINGSYNDAPVASNDDAYSQVAGISVDAPGVLGNDTDPEAERRLL